MVGTKVKLSAFLFVLFHKIKTKKNPQKVQNGKIENVAGSV
jgi:hypothetical protein